VIVHPDGYVELYDHAAPERETHNVAADQPELVKEMLARLNERLPAIPAY